jgi:protein-S-isoprenylcysteine O-methyltransferase Ste14
VATVVCVTRDRIPTLGRRGEGWVIAQSVAIVAIVVAGIVGPSWPDPVDRFLVVLGITVAGAGITLVGAGVAALGSSLSPYPRPLEHSTLRQRGAYRLVRHPIYGGILLLALGWSGMSSPVALVPSAVLVLVFELKARVEESMLAQRFPEYAAYRARARWRFVPGIR